MSGGGGDNSSGMSMAMMQQNANQARQDQYNNSRQARQDAADAAERKREYEQNARQYGIDRADRIQASQLARQDAVQQQKLEQQARQQDYARADAASARDRQYQLDDRTHSEQLAQQERDRQTATQAAADKKAQDKLDAWNSQRSGVFNSAQSDALSQLSSRGITDPRIAASVKSAYNNANQSIPELANNPGGYFDGLLDTVLGRETDAARSRNTKSLNSLLPDNFQQDKVGDTVDDSILESILGEQYNSASAQAKRLLDRGVITQEGYDANLKNLDTQKAAGRAKLTTLGNNELNSERTKLGNLANQGRQAASNYELGGNAFDANQYAGKVNSAYDDWFKNLDQTYRGFAPTDLFDTSGFLNTAGSVSGPTNSPFVGSTNALTGADATVANSNDPTDPTKKKQSSSVGVF